MIKNTIFINRNKHRNKSNYSAAVIKKQLKHFPMSEGNTCIAEEPVGEGLV